MTNEELRNLLNEPVKVEKTLVFKCKPTYQFQSIEFDYICTKEEIPNMIKCYKYILDELIKIAPEQEKKPVKNLDLATDKQKAIMTKHNIKFTASTTRQEAQALIQESIDNSL